MLSKDFYTGLQNDSDYAPANHQAKNPDPARKEEVPALVTDVIVIGSGFAGLAAAIEAAEAGASVMILEKMKAPGGNSRISDGGIAAPDTSYQAEEGIIDTPELMYRDMLTAGEGLNHPGLVKIITDQAKEAFLWTRDYLGVKYKNRVDIFGGHSVPRCYTPESISGSSLIKQQLAHLKRLNLSVHCGARVRSLLQDQSGRINGVHIIDGYRYKYPFTGVEKNITAVNAVIVATGGFSSDIAYRQAQDPRLDSSLLTTNQPFATAEMLKECLRIGANPVQLSRIQLGPWASPDEKGFGLGPLFGDYVVLPYGILVNPQTGTRFVNELSDRGSLAEALLKQEQPVIGIADAAGVEIAGWDLSRALSRGVVKIFDDLQGLAVYYGFKSEALYLTVAGFNAMVQNGTDLDFGKNILKEARPLQRAPFYAMRMWPKVHHTMGGIQIDTSARVIHRDQYPIPGLFAAGEVTGGVHGSSRLGSCAITECLVMGRIAGREAAASL